MNKFNDIINSSTPTLVDFHATWCAPCHALAPILSDLAKEIDKKARIIKVDIDKNQAVASKYNVRSVPTLILFKEGKIIWQQAGVQPKETLKNIINQNV